MSYHSENVIPVRMKTFQGLLERSKRTHGCCEVAAVAAYSLNDQLLSSNDPLTFGNVTIRLN